MTKIILAILLTVFFWTPKLLEYGTVVPNTYNADDNDDDNENDTEYYDCDSEIYYIDSIQDEFMSIEGVDAENEGVKNGGRVDVDANALSTEQKLGCVRNPTNINYNNGRDNRHCRCPCPT